MKRKIFQICISISLIMFFGAAALLTVLSHQNYLSGCVPVELLENTTSGSITITRNCYAECAIGTDGIFKFCWDNGEVYETLKIGDLLKVDLGDRFVPAEILNRYELNGERTFVARIYAWIGDILAQQPAGFMVYASYPGPQRAYIIPASCVREAEGGYEVAVATEEPKTWGMSYKVSYKRIQVHEMDEERCAVMGLPVDGVIIYSSKERLWEGADILITNNND